MFDDLLKLVFAPIYIPYKVVKKIDECVESLDKPFYWPDHLPQNEPPKDDSEK